MPTDELAKLGNTVTADYIVVSKINNLTSRVNKEKLLGETIKINSVKADLLINIINVPTSQIIYSDSFKLEQINSNIEKLASIISKRLSRKVIDTFFPAKSKFLSFIIFLYLLPGYIYPFFYNNLLLQFIFYTYNNNFIFFY